MRVYVVQETVKMSRNLYVESNSAYSAREKVSRGEYLDAEDWKIVPKSSLYANIRILSRDNV